MAVGRYGFVASKINNDESYNDFFKSKNVKSITHLTTKKYSDIKQSSEDFNINIHVCGPTDKLITISTLYYGNPRYWYLIALTNNIPNDFFIEDGLELNIYFPLEKVLEFYNGR